jgi:hypothetical protein
MRGSLEHLSWHSEVKIEENRLQLLAEKRKNVDEVMVFQFNPEGWIDRKKTSALDVEILTCGTVKSSCQNPGFCASMLDGWHSIRWLFLLSYILK